MRFPTVLVRSLLRNSFASLFLLSLTLPSTSFAEPVIDEINALMPPNSQNQFLFDYSGGAANIIDGDEYGSLVGQAYTFRNPCQQGPGAQGYIDCDLDNDGSIDLQQFNDIITTPTLIPFASVAGAPVFQPDDWHADLGPDLEDPSDDIANPCKLGSDGSWRCPSSGAVTSINTTDFGSGFYSSVLGGYLNQVVCNACDPTDPCNSLPAESMVEVPEPLSWIAYNNDVLPRGIRYEIKEHFSSTIIGIEGDVELAQFSGRVSAIDGANRMAGYLISGTCEQQMQYKIPFVIRQGVNELVIIQIPSGYPYTEGEATAIADGFVVGHMNDDVGNKAGFLCKFDETASACEAHIFSDFERVEFHDIQIVGDLAYVVGSETQGLTTPKAKFWTINVSNITNPIIVSEQFIPMGFTTLNQSRAYAITSTGYIAGSASSDLANWNAAAENAGFIAIPVFGENGAIVDFASHNANAISLLPDGFTPAGFDRVNGLTNDLRVLGSGVVQSAILPILENRLGVAGQVFDAPPTVIQLGCSDGSYEDRVECAWQSPSAAPGVEATSYNVYRREQSSGDDYEPVANVTTLSFTDFSVISGVIYEYQIQACNDSGYCNVIDQDLTGNAQVGDNADLGHAELVTPDQPKGPFRILAPEDPFSLSPGR